MISVEKNLNRKNVELANIHPELINHREREQKFHVSKKHRMHELYGAEAQPIEQVYLSSPNDDFNLRVRKKGQGDTTEYTATLKDRGEVIDGALDRLEINTPISREAYEWFAANPNFARVDKQRAEPYEGVSIDFFKDGNVQIVEIEHDDPLKRQELLQLLTSQIGDALWDVTGSPQFSNEWLAATNFGTETLPQAPESLDAFSERITSEMLARYVTGKNQVVVGLTGMSGSGKTTVTRAIQERITELFGESFTPLVMSTDDYHFGKKKLDAITGEPWTAWDDPRTYNTAELAQDLLLTSRGETLIRRHFDFETEEPVFDEEVLPSPFIIIEGLYAGSTDLKDVRDLHFELPTSIATSVGRDIRRLIIENRANRVFPTPESRLQYQLEVGIPTYLSQERPGRNTFSASTRSIGERAFMLERLHDTN